MDFDARVEAGRDTLEHVFNRVYSDYRSRLDRVVGEITGSRRRAELSIAALSSRLGEVAKDEEAKRDEMSGSRAACGGGRIRRRSVGVDASRCRSGARQDRRRSRFSRSQLGELRNIRKLSEMTAPAGEAATPVSAAQAGPVKAEPAKAEPHKPEAPRAEQQQTAAAPQMAESKVEGPTTFVSADRGEEPATPKKFSDAGWPARDIVETVPGCRHAAAANAR